MNINFSSLDLMNESPVLVYM